MEKQIRFLEEIEKRVPGNKNFTKVLADQLGLTSSSIRKKRKGITALSVRDLEKLSNYYEVPIDQFYNAESYRNRIDYLTIDISSTEGYREYLLKMRDKLLATSEAGSLWEICSDLPPPFPLYLYPEASAFLFYTDMIKKQREGVVFEVFIEELKAAGVFKIYREIYDHYLNVDSKEVYSLQAFSYISDTLIRHADSKLFGAMETAFLILNQLQKLVLTLKDWITTGKKKRGKYALYLSEEMIGNNIILCQREQNKGVCITAVKGHGVKFINDQNFKEAMQDFMDGLRQMYSCMCSIGEVRRDKIFNDFFLITEETRKKLNSKMNKPIIL